MSSDHIHVRTSGDSSAADDAPCTSPAGSGGRKVKLICAYGGKILHRPIDGVLRYAGGESRIINIRRGASLPEFLRKMSDTYGGPVAVRYQLPNEDLDSLISVSTTEDLENMMEEVDGIAGDNPSAKLRVFLFSPAEAGGVSMNQHYSEKDRQDQNTMYIEAVNGLDNRLPRKDSMTSVSSTQNSDGVEAAVNGLDEGTPPVILSSTDTNAHDQSQPVIPVQSMHDLSTTINSIDKNEFINATQSNIPPSAPFLQESCVNPHHSQFTSSQPSVVAVLHQQVIVASSPPPSYVPATLDTLPLISHPGNEMTIQKREDQILDEKTSVKKIAKVQSEPNVQPQLPPLPPPHLLAPKAQTLRLEECSLCQKTLPHSHSDTVINDQDNGSRIAQPVLPIHHSDEITRLRDPQVGVIEELTDNMTEMQSENLMYATPLVTYEMPCNIAKLNVLVTNNNDKMKSSDQGSAALAISLLAAHDTTTYLQTAQQDAPMQTKQVLHNDLGPNWENGHSFFMRQPFLCPGEISDGPPKPCWEEDLQGQLQLPQNMIPFKHEPANHPLVANFSSVENPNLQGVLAKFSGYDNPVEEMIGSLYVSSSGAPSALSEQQKLDVLHDMYTSKDLKPDILLSVIENSIAAGPLDEPNAIPLNDLLVNNGVVLNGQTCMQVDPLSSTEQEFIYIQSPQAAKANYTFHETGNDPLIDIGMPDYENKKDETSKSQSKEVFDDILIPISDNSQVDPNNQITNTEPIQGQVSSDSLLFNDDRQKILGFIPVLSPSPTNVSGKEAVFMNETMPDIQSLDTKVSAVMVLEGVATYPSQSSKDLGTDLLPLKDYKHIEQDMTASAEKTVAPMVYLSKPSINNFASHHPNNEEQGTKENSVERADKKDETIKDAKQHEKLINGFPSLVDIGHLQVIKNSDLEEIRELGSGTFGTVYHGKWKGSDVAIKRLNEFVFNGKSSDQERARADFWNEARKLSSLHHPNVMALYGIVLDGPGGNIATVTEFMVNGSLRVALAKNDKTLDWRKRLLIAMDVAFGMEYLHSRNIIHFDLKSDNLLVNLRDPQRPICKVGDLGLSKVKFETLKSGGMRGTLPWMAPELLDGKTKYTEKIDVYSFGIVMWELLTGDEPYADLRYGAIIGGIVKNTLRPPVPESCDAEWRSLMEQCWTIEPTERPSFTEIASRLRSMGASNSSKMVDYIK